MTMNILVAIQQGYTQSQTVRRACELAKLDNGNAVIRLCCVMFDAHIDGDPVLIEAVKNWAISAEAKQLDGIADRMVKKCQRVEVDLRWGTPQADELIASAHEVKADIIIAPVQKRPKFARMVFGQQELELIRQSPIPILSVRSEASIPYRKIVVCVDPVHVADPTGELDDQLVRAASKLSDAGNANVYLVSAHPNPTYYANEACSLPAGTFEQWKRSQVSSVERLAERHGIDFSCVRILSGEPASTVPQVVDELRADLLVIGSLSRRHRRRLVGENTSKLLDHVDCDVLTIGVNSMGSMV